MVTKRELRKQIETILWDNAMCAHMSQGKPCKICKEDKIKVKRLVEIWREKYKP